MVKSNDASKVIASALKSVRAAVKESGGRSKIGQMRVLPVPNKVGGALPLVPVFAGLSALGSLAGGAAGIAKAINDTSEAQKLLEEAKRHNKAMEDINIGKGLYLKPYKTGDSLKLHRVADKKKKKRAAKKKKKTSFINLPRRALTDVDIVKYGKKLKTPILQGSFYEKCASKAWTSIKRISSSKFGRQKRFWDSLGCL